MNRVGTSLIRASILHRTRNGADIQLLDWSLRLAVSVTGIPELKVKVSHHDFPTKFDFALELNLVLQRSYRYCLQTDTLDCLNTRQFRFDRNFLVIHFQSCVNRRGIPDVVSL